MKLFEKEAHFIVILALISACLFLVGLGAMPLTDPDEVFYAETAKEMLARGELLTPYIFGKPQFEKPPLYYWSVITGFRALGVNAFAARVSSGIFGILGVIGVYFLGKLLINKRTGFFAGLILATSVMYIAIARACVTDMLLLVLILYTFLFFFYGYKATLGKTKWYLLSFVFVGLAVLAKGPIGIFFPAAIIGIFLLATRQVKRIREIPIFWGTLLLLAVALPWYILMYRVHGKEFIDVFFGFHNITRFLEPEHAIGDVFYYYVPVLFAGFAPWSAIVPLGMWQALRERISETRKAGIFFIVWTLVIFIFFSFSRTKLPTYIFPLYPALAILAGRTIDVFLEGKVTGKMKLWMRASLVLYFVLIAGGLMALYFVARVKFPTAAQAAAVTGAGFTLATAFFITAFWMKKYLTGFIVFLVSWAILVFPVSYIILPEIGKYVSSRHISGELLKRMEPTEALGAETRYRRGVAFYVGREDVPDVHSHDALTKFLKRKDRVWCVLKDKNHRQLYTDTKKPYDNPTYLVYKIGKKVIVTNKIPPGMKYIKLRSVNDPY